MGGNPSRVRVTGPLEPYAAGFASALTRIGYTQHSTAHQLRVFAHLSRWLATGGVDVAELTPALRCVSECAASRRLHALVISKGGSAAAEVLTRGGCSPTGASHRTESNRRDAGAFWRLSGLRTWSGTVDGQ
jgi:hypothetical protein